jgi:ribokinase
MTVLRVGVVGHVEWCDFVRVERLPRPGEIVHAREAWAEPAGGGAVAAVQLCRLAGSATFLTAVGDDDVGARAREGLERLGVDVHAAVREEPQRRAVIYLERDGERTITLLSRKLTPRAADPLPWRALAGADGVYFTGGDADAVRRARSARVLVATARELPTLVEAAVPIDALVRSGSDAGERYEPGDLEPPPRLVIATGGRRGGVYTVDGGPERRFAAAELPGPIVDTYGAGDSFAAGITFALARGGDVEPTLDFAARCGAAALTGRGPYGAPMPR